MNQSRRKLIAAVGAMTAGQAFLDDNVKADSNPAGLVADRSSTIRIKSMKATPAGSKVYLKMETNHGITGWGEIDQLEPKVAAALATSLFELLDGENPTRIEYLWQKLFRAHRNIRGGPFMIHTIAGIDMALWDITGKLWNTPIYRILGGPCRDKILVYPSIRATKPGAGPSEFSGTPAELQRFVDYIKAERKKVGPNGIVIFDAHCALPPPFLIQLANALDPTDVNFIEEIAVPGNIEVFKRIKQAVKIPLASGERDRTIYEFLPYLQEKCLDVIQPDCAHCGGITQMVKIATLAELYFTPLAPHAVTTELGISASFHATAVAPFFIIHEYYPQITPAGLIRKSWSVDKDGYASLPQGPGLGAEIDEEKLEELAKKPHKPEWPTRGRLKDGSIADY